MFIRVAKGQKQGLGIGTTNLYPGHAGDAGRWEYIEGYGATIDKLVAEGRIEKYMGEGTPYDEDVKKEATKGERARARLEYTQVLQKEHWSKVAARIRQEATEEAVMDWYQAAKEMDFDEDSGVVKAIRQRLEELQGE